MVLNVSINLLLFDWATSDSKGRSFLVVQKPFLLLAYHSINLVGLNVFVKPPFFNSVLVLFWTIVK